MNVCQHCGKEIESDAVQGICPACLLKAGFESASLSGSQQRAKTEPPTVERLRELFPQLEILEFLGQGGMGAVYKARQPRLDRVVALKILLPDVGNDPAFAERFIIEARALAKLNHPNIITIHDFGQVEDLFYFVMEFVDGLSLRQLLAAERMSPREALAIVPQICDALQFAHDTGIVHRDIKPENILMDRLGRVKVADFGLAKLMGSAEPEGESGSPGASFELSEAGLVLGTPQYMAPEQMTHPRDVDHRADIYALGVVFYQMLTGELPGKRLEPPSRKVQIDVRLDEVVLRALEKLPELRYQQVSDVKTMVETIAATSAPIGNQGGNQQVLNEARRQVRWPALGLLVSSLLSPFLPGVLVLTGRMQIGAWCFWPFLFVLSGTAVAAFGALRMKRLESYRMALTGSISACLISFFNLFCLPFAVWALAVLVRQNVRRAFTLARELPDNAVEKTDDVWGASSAKKNGYPKEESAMPELEETAQIGTHDVPSRFSRTAIVGACWLGVGLLSLVFWFILLSIFVKYEIPAAVRAATQHIQIQPITHSWWEGLLGYIVLGVLYSTPFGTTILSWIAVAQIRRSAGRLYGMRLALFDGLLFPLLALDALLYYQVAPPLMAGMGLLQNESVAFISRGIFIGLLVLFDYGIIRHVWRAVNSRSNHSGTIFFPLNGVRASIKHVLSPRFVLGVFLLLLLGGIVLGTLQTTVRQSTHIGRSTESPDLQIENIRTGWNSVTIEGRAVANAKLYFYVGKMKNQPWFCNLPQTGTFTAVLKRDWLGNLSWEVSNDKGVFATLDKIDVAALVADDFPAPRPHGKLEFLINNTMSRGSQIAEWKVSGTEEAIPIAVFLTPPGGVLAPNDISSVAMDSMTKLANDPFKLEKLPTDKLIEVGISHPSSAWVWQKLQDRSLTPEQVSHVMKGLTEWVEREHPKGLTEPLSWLDPYLKKLCETKQISDEQAVAFTEAVHGELRVSVGMPRLREGITYFNFPNVDWAYTWWFENGLGLVLMNEVTQITVDDKPIALPKSDQRNWKQRGLWIGSSMTLPPLTPGKHKIKLEVLSALVADADVRGLSSNAPSSDWPPAKKRWTRTAKWDLTVYPKDAVIVQQTDDPALNPVPPTGGLTVKPIVIRPKGSKKQVAVEVVVEGNKLPVAVSADVLLRIDGKEIPCGTKAFSDGGRVLSYTSKGDGGSDSIFTVELSDLSPEVLEAEVVLTPDPRFVESNAIVKRIWGKEIVFSHVPLKRLDIASSRGDTTVTTTTTVSNQLPQLSFLAWQYPGEDYRVKMVKPAWNPDGFSVDGKGIERKLLQSNTLTFVDDSKNPESRPLEIWWSHPLFDNLSYFDVKFFGDKKLGTSSSHAAVSDHPSWLCYTVALAKNVVWPKQARMTLRYSMGVWKDERQVALDCTKHQPTISLPKGEYITVSSIGQDEKGRAFIAAVSSEDDLPKMQYVFFASKKDGTRLTRIDTRYGYFGAGKKQETYFFDVPLDQLQEFYLCSRPIQEATVDKVLLKLDAATEVPSVKDAKPVVNADSVPVPKSFSGARVTGETSTTLLKQLPELRFLTWQPEMGKKSDSPQPAWHSDGSPIDGNTLEKRMANDYGTFCSNSNDPEMRFLRLGWSHPLLGSQSYAELEILNDADQVLDMSGANGSTTQEPSSNNGNLGWFIYTIGVHKDWPAQVKVRLRYALDSWKEGTTKIPFDFKGATAWGEASSVGSVGQDAAGNAFITILQDKRKDRNVQYDFVVFTRDGRRLTKYNPLCTRADDQLQSKFTFEIPLAQVKEFQLRTRPMRETVIPNVPILLDKISTATQSNSAMVGVKNPNPGHFVRLVTGANKMTFEGRETTLEKLPDLLKEVPDRTNTVFEVAFSPEEKR